MQNRALGRRGIIVKWFEPLNQGEKYLVMMHGLPWSGKTNTAQYLTYALGLKYLRNDEIRVELNTSDISVEMVNDLVYRNLIHRALDSISHSSVVMDGTFTMASRRWWVFESVLSLEIPIIIIHCYCNEQTSLLRLYQRNEEPHMPQYLQKHMYDYVKSRIQPLHHNEIFNLRKSAIIDFCTDTKTIGIRFQKGIKISPNVIIKLLKEIPI
jgi:predicted kinase